MTTPGHCTSMDDPRTPNTMPPRVTFADQLSQVSPSRQSAFGREEPGDISTTPPHPQGALPEILQLLSALPGPAPLIFILKISTGFQNNNVKSDLEGTSLVAQWLRIRLPMQGTRV